MHAFVQHRYGLTACGGRTLTPTELMNASTTWPTANDTAVLAEVAAAGLPFVLGEGNTVSCNGYHGVSDVYAAALYAIDAMFGAWSAGIACYKWHGLGLNSTAFFYQPVYYDPVRLGDAGWDVAQPRPLFLGLWAFASTVQPGSRLLAINATGTGQLLRAWATHNASAVAVTVLNKHGAGDSEAVVVHPAKACLPGAAASLVRLTSGPGGLAASAGSAFANQSFDGTTDGIPVGTRVVEPVPCEAGVYTFSVPAASAAFLTYPVAAGSSSASF